MKVLHVIWSLDPQGGGPPMVAARLAAAQAALGHEVGVLSYAPHTEKGQARIDAALDGIPGLDLVRRPTLPAPNRLERLLGRHARQKLNRLATTPGILHLHGVWDPIIKAGADAARLHHVPYVIRPCGMLDPWSLSQSRLKKRIALTLGYRRMLREAAFLQTLNDDETRLIEQLDLGCPMRVIPNGVFIEELNPLPPIGTFHRSHPELKGRPFVLFLSRLHYKKGLDYLADAFSLVAPAHPDVQLVVAGPDGGARAEFARDIKVRKIADRVHVVGPLYGPDKLAALADATCFCLPSRQEGFSMAITEALACGVPVVITEPCHFPEVAAAGAGEVVALSGQAVGEALNRVLGDPDARNRMAESARRLVETHYTWPHIAQTTIEAYRALLSASTNPPSE